MAKRITKYESVLSEARERVEVAGARVEELEQDLATATAVFQALNKSYLALQRSLTPTPRKTSTKKASTASAPTPKEPAEKEAKCGVCGNPREHSDQDRAYLKSHDFDEGKSVARAPSQSKQKPPDFGSVQSSEIAKDFAGVAALAASGD
ncbi:MAG TPA: hypothetical protein VHO25_10030 [Polyangiaceae bacterium]|nr:hypothetical protein [Polyangiaceae bacterium]